MMSLEAVLQDLHIQLRHLHDAIHGLRMIVVDDQPPVEGTVLVDQFGYAADDLVGWSEEMIAAVAAARAAAAENPTDTETVRRSLALSQERHNRIVRRFGSDLASHERIEALLQFGKQFRKEWAPWSIAVRESVSGCRPALDDASDALLVAWRELSERIGMNSVSVRTTNIGQRISVQRPEFAREGLP
jgi:hypothetical protein